MNTKKNILITGGAGFIGSNLSTFFLNQGNKVVVIDNFLTSNKENLSSFKSNIDFEFFFGDVTQKKIFTQLNKMNFDIIYHLASPASPKQYVKYPTETLMANSLGTLNTIDYVLKSRSHTFIYASTSEIYGDPLLHPQPESYWGNVNPVGIRSCYDESKRFGETVCTTSYRQNNIDVRIARIFNTYGPNMEKDDGRVISNFIVQSLSNKDITIYGNGTQTRSFCYISDLVEGLVALSQPNLAGQIINIGNDDEKKIVDIAKLIKKKTASKSQLVFKPLPSDDPQKRKPDLSKARKLLDWQPKIDLSNGIDKTITYFKTRFKI